MQIHGAEGDRTPDLLVANHQLIQGFRNFRSLIYPCRDRDAVAPRDAMIEHSVRDRCLRPGTNDMLLAVMSEARKVRDVAVIDRA